VDEDVRVYLIDRAGPAANAFAAKLESREGVELVSGAAEVEEALQDISDSHPDVILVGTDVGGAGVVDAIERVLTVAGDGAVVALSTRDDKALVDAAIRAGASGSLDRTASVGETITALHVYRGRQRGEYVDMKLAEPPGQVAGLRVSGALPRFPTATADPQEVYSSPSTAASGASQPTTPSDLEADQAGAEPGDDLTEMRDMLRREAAHAAKKAPKKKGWRLFGRRQKSSPFGPTVGDAGSGDAGAGEAGSDDSEAGDAGGGDRVE
jgi:DNA-binding NarL/FixJ family response regulator